MDLDNKIWATLGKHNPDLPVEYQDAYYQSLNEFERYLLLNFKSITDQTALRLTLALFATLNGQPGLGRAIDSQTKTCFQNFFSTTDLHHSDHSCKSLKIIPILGIFIQIDFMARNTSILLGEHFEEFISSEVSSGRYSSASEVVRTALRLLEAEESRKKQLNKALVKGEKSGFDKNFNAVAHLKKLHSKLK
jgi:antitoxin ParD1/3/4